MILAFILFAIAAAIIGYAVYQQHSLVGKERVGTVESFRLTWGQQGQQILTVDGREYNVWLDFREFGKVERGNIIRHRPFWHRSMGRKLLSTNIIAVENKKKKDAAQTQSRRPVPA